MLVGAGGAGKPADPGGPKDEAPATGLRRGQGRAGESLAGPAR